jgi:glycyl-tRNA synthetase
VLAILTEAYNEQQVKEIAPDRQEAIVSSLESFLKSVNRNDKLSPEQRDALIDRAQTVRDGLPATLPQVQALLDMPGAKNIQVSKNVRGQAEPVLDESFRTVLNLKPAMAPIKVAVLPLKRNNPNIVDLAKSIRKDLQSSLAMRTVYDDTGSIGRLYRRQDEIGTPFCITVDFDSLGEGKELTHKDTVTVRNRDTMEQERVPIAELSGYLFERMK